MQSAPQVIAWLNGLNSTHFKSEKVAGMKHESRPDLAVKRFLEAMTEVAGEFEAEAREAYPELLRQADDQRKQQGLAAALRHYRQAAEFEEYYPALGRGGTQGVRQIENAAKAMLAKIHNLMRNRQGEAAVMLQELLTRYAGTAAAAEGEKLLPQLPPPTATDGGH